MHDISKHDTKEERERNYGEYSRVDLLVIGNTIGVHNLLEHPDEVVGFEHRWLFQSWDVLSGFLVVQASDAFVVNDALEFVAQVVKLRNPNESVEEYSILNEHVKICVDNLLLHDEDLVNLKDADILVAFVLIGLNQVLSENFLGLTDDVLGSLFLVLSLLEFLVKSGQLSLEDLSWET